MFSRGKVNTGTPARLVPDGGSAPKKERSGDGLFKRSPLNQMLVFISAVISGMVLTILFFNYYEQSDPMNGISFSASVEGDGLGDQSNVGGLRVSSPLAPPPLVSLKKSASFGLETIINKPEPVENMITTIDPPIVEEKSRGTDVSVAQARKEARELLKKAKATLKWLSGQIVDKSSDCPISWTRLSNAEVHILNKIEEYLEFYLSSENEERFDTLLTKGLTCDAVQQEQQTIISKVIAMDICSEVEWYKLAQFTYPDAKTMLDVGGNKGYLGSLFLALWGGGGHGLTPAGLLQKTANENTWVGSRNPAGYCKDGYNHGVPYYCPPEHRQPNGQCMNKRDGVTVTSFDGSGYLVKTLNKLITTFEGASEEVRRGSVWKYLHHAVSDTEGIAHFWAGPKNKESNAGFEGGKLRGGEGADTEEVQMITVDAYAQKAGLPGVDILKIDAEGNDNKVIRGGRKAIDGGAALFTFEGGGGVSFTKEDIEELDTRGFSCFSTSRAGLFRWSGGCMSETYMGSFRAKDKGNVFCTSRRRAPLMAAIFDALSFPMLIEQRVREGASPTGSRPQKDPFPRDNKAGEKFTEVYVNIRPFCSPFPACAAVSASSA